MAATPPADPAAAPLPPAPPRTLSSKGRGWLRRAAIAACFLAGGAPWPHPALPLAMIAAGGSLHFAAKGWLVRRAVVVRRGPYRWVRHPFYLGNLLLEAGLLLFAGAWWALPLYAAAAAWSYRATLAEEESDLAALHGAAWTEYAAAVPRLLPLRGPCPPGDGPGFSWRNLVYEREIPRILRLLSLPLGLAWWAAFRAQPGPLLERPLLAPPADRNAKLLVLFLGVQAFSWFLGMLLAAPRLDGTARIRPGE